MENKPKISQRFTRYISTIRARILLITISFMLLFGLIASSASYYITSRNIQKTLIQTAENRLSYLCSSVETGLSNVNVFVKSCQTNKKVIAFASDVSEKSNLTRLEAHDIVSEFYLSNSELPSQLVRMVIVRGSRGDFIQIMQPFHSSTAVSANGIEELPYFEEIHNNPGTSAAGIFSDPFLPNIKLQMIPYISIIQEPYSAEEAGYIYTELSTTLLTQPLLEDSSSDPSAFSFHIGDTSYIYDKENELLLPENSSYEILQTLSGVSLDSETTVTLVKNTSDQKNYYCVTRPVKSIGWSMSEYIDSHKIYETMGTSLSLIILVILLIISVLGFGLFLFLTQTVEKPVQKLKMRMERIKKGDFSRDPSTEWNHELGEIGKTINDLSENVDSLMNQRISDEKEKKDYEYRMLQSQINPHFLYNTLNSIKWMATIQCAPGIAEMTTSLSRLLKDISKGASNLVTIEHEFDLIKDYFLIQKYRYGGTITMDIDIDDDELLDCPILKFTLQPLVENAIFHGIEPKGTAGTIRIHLYQENDHTVRIDVTDDGVGMESDVAQSLLTEKSEKNHSSFFREIGISNVDKRLKYEFGPEYGLSVESVPGEYTTISVLLPVQITEDMV